MTTANEPAPGRRERKKAQTRKALADAALRLFLERGYDGVSVKDVAEAADVSVTTLFKHFSGKEALVF
ncbi:TetR/AcrR family transcriptional regulator, partial [Streptomyces sp. NBRC 110611]